MRRVRELLDWRFLLAAAFLLLVVEAGFNSWANAQHNDVLVAQMKRDRAASAVERAEASKERARLVEGQEQLRRDYQLLLDYLEAEGIPVPPALARAITLGSSGRDDDDGDTTITVRPETPNSGGSTSAPNQPGPTPSQSDDPDMVEDLTERVEDTVEDTQGFTEDTIKDLTDNLDAIVDP